MDKVKPIGIKDEHGSYCQYWPVKPGTIVNTLTGQVIADNIPSMLPHGQLTIVAPTTKKKEKLKTWNQTLLTVVFVEIKEWFESQNLDSYNTILVGTSGWKLFKDLGLCNFKLKNDFKGKITSSNYSTDPKTGEPIKIETIYEIKYEPYFNIDSILIGNRELGPTAMIKLLYTEELFADG
ncbi:MAG TPA: hypothetical protein PLP33_07095 [Leptospiraceae bacterium]|nr:hypothetical protein [Leptospiraceae bacterium]